MLVTGEMYPCVRARMHTCVHIYPYSGWGVNMATLLLYVQFLCEPKTALKKENLLRKKENLKFR